MKKDLRPSQFKLANQREVSSKSMSSASSLSAHDFVNQLKNAKSPPEVTQFKFTLDSKLRETTINYADGSKYTGGFIR